MKRVIPSKRICTGFRLIYELEGAQKAANFLARYYKIRSMKIIVNGRRAGNGNDASYDNYTAYFNKKKINKSLILHEFYHHLVYTKKWEIGKTREEKEADSYARNILKAFFTIHEKKA